MFRALTIVFTVAAFANVALSIGYDEYDTLFYYSVIWLVVWVPSRLYAIGLRRHYDAKRRLDIVEMNHSIRRQQIMDGLAREGLL